MKILKLRPIMSVEESDSLAGETLKESDCKLLIRKDTDVYDQESGNCIAKFRTGVIPAKLQIAAYESLLGAAKATDNRGTSTGKDEDGKASRYAVTKAGKLSKTSHSAKGPINSGIIGYFDRNPRFPYCRLTSFNSYEFDKFKKAYSIIKMVDHTYSELMPDHYAKQRKLADSTSQDFVIKGTAFTTVTVNKNWQTAVHKDKGDFKDGFGNLVALRRGTFTGGHLILVRWGVGFDLQNGDVLMMDVHQWHANTPIVKDDPNAIRLSLVMYYREKMKACGTLKQELQRAKNRKHGDSL